MMRKILVVDDEPVQLETICRGLRLFGYDCAQATDGAQALDILTGVGGDTIELLLTDLTMPHKSGLELIQHVRIRKPDLPVMVFTGINSSPDVWKILDAGIPVLHKPFAPDELINTIQSILG